MAVKTSGTLGFSDVQTEFGHPEPVKMSDFYRGGPYVPAYREVSGRVIYWDQKQGPFLLPDAPVTGFVIDVYTFSNSVMWQGSNQGFVNIQTDTIPVPFVAWLSRMIDGVLYNYMYEVTAPFVSQGVNRIYTLSRTPFATEITQEDMNTNVSQSGVIKLSQMYGASKT